MQAGMNKALGPIGFKIVTKGDPEDGAWSVLENTKLQAFQVTADVDHACVLGGCMHVLSVFISMWHPAYMTRAGEHQAAGLPGEPWQKCSTWAGCSRMVHKHVQARALPGYDSCCCCARMSWSHEVC